MKKNFVFSILLAALIVLFLAGVLYADQYDGNMRGYRDGYGGRGCGFNDSDNDRTGDDWHGRRGGDGWHREEWCDGPMSGFGFMHWGMDLSDDQYDRMTAIHDGYFESGDDSFDKLHEAKWELMQAIHAENIDEGAIRDAAGRWADLQADNAVDMAYMMQDVREILTDEQRDRMDDWCFDRDGYDDDGDYSYDSDNYCRRGCGR